MGAGTSHFALKPCLGRHSSFPMAEHCSQEAEWVYSREGGTRYNCSIHFDLTILVLRFFPKHATILSCNVPDKSNQGEMFIHLGHTKFKGPVHYYGEVALLV